MGTGDRDRWPPGAPWPAWAPPHRRCRLPEATRAYGSFAGTRAGLPTDPQDVARGAVPCPPFSCVTGETQPLGKDEVHLGDQGPWKEGRKHGLGARASSIGYVLSSDCPEPSPRGGGRAGRHGAGGLAGAHVHAPSRARGLAGGVNVAIRGQRAIRRTPRSLSVGRAGPLCCSRPSFSAWGWPSPAVLPL